MPIRHLKIHRQQPERNKSKALLEVVQEDLQALVEKMEAVLEGLESPDSASELGGNRGSKLPKYAGRDCKEVKL